MALFKIVLLFTLLALFMVAMGGVLGLFFGSPYLIMGAMFIFAIGLNVFFYFKSDTIALRLTRSRITSKSENPRLYNVVKKVSEEAGIPMPKIGIMDSSVPNAFATGRDEKHAVVVATSSILKMLDDKELEAVIGHEISHVTHRDILVTTIAASIATIVSYIGNIMLFSMLFNNSNDNNLGFLVILSAILIPIGAMFVQLGISRSRESYADVGSVKLVKKPNELISSLKKISSVSVNSQPRNVSRPNPQAASFSSLFIVNNLSTHSITNLFSTHPSLEKRIEAIKKTAMEMGLTVYE